MSTDCGRLHSNLVWTMPAYGSSFLRPEQEIWHSHLPQGWCWWSPGEILLLLSELLILQYPWSQTSRHCLANSDFNHDLFFTTASSSSSSIIFQNFCFFGTLWLEDWNNFTHPTFGSALLQGSSDQREPNASETCASDSYMLDAHSLLPPPLPSSVFCKVHQIKKIQMLLRHVHQILTSCCLFLQSLLDRMFLITTTIFCSLQHESESNASLRHVHQILTCLFLPSLLNHMLVTTAIFWCPIAKIYARMLSYFF